MQSKLGLDSQKISHAKQIAKNIAGDVQNFVDGYTTVTVERTVCRLLGIDGVDANGVPLPNVVVDHLKNNGNWRQNSLLRRCSWDIRGSREYLLKSRSLGRRLGCRCETHQSRLNASGTSHTWQLDQIWEINLGIWISELRVRIRRYA